MTPNPQAIAALEEALAKAREGSIQTVMIAAVTPDNFGVIHSNMDDDDMINTLDWLEAALSEPAGEVFTYAIH